MTGSNQKRRPCQESGCGRLLRVLGAFVVLILGLAAILMVPEKTAEAFSQMEQPAVVLKRAGSMFWVAPLLPGEPCPGEPGIEIQVDVYGEKVPFWLKPMHIQPVFVGAIHETIDWLGTTRYEAIRNYVAEWLKGNQ